MPLSNGVPLIVNVSPNQLCVIPWGKPVTSAPVAPVVNITISVIGEFIQTVWFIPGVMLFSGLTVKVVLSFVVPHSLDTERKIVDKPVISTIVGGGFGKIEFKPEGELDQLYKREESAQLSTFTDGSYTYGTQPFTISFKLTIGGFLTITICSGDVSEPHSFVVVSEILYCPELSNWKIGFLDWLVVESVYENDEADPQYPLE